MNKTFLNTFIIVVSRKTYKIKNKNYSNSYTVQKTSLINSTFSMFLCLSTGLASMIKPASCLHCHGNFYKYKKLPWLETSGLKETKCPEERGCMLALIYTDFVLFYYSKDH